MRACMEHSRTLNSRSRNPSKLQSHYAALLNMHDGGNRLQFTTAEDWIARLVEIGQLKRNEIDNTQLVWRLPRASDTETLPVELRSILVKRFNIKPREPYLFDPTFLPYIQGLFDAGIHGAKELIDAIDKNEKVELLIF